MPVLFGSAYLLPAIIVVVLLIILLAILATRKRGSKTAVKKAKPAASAPPAPTVTAERVRRPLSEDQIVTMPTRSAPTEAPAPPASATEAAPEPGTQKPTGEKAAATPAGAVTAPIEQTPVMPEAEAPSSPRAATPSLVTAPEEALAVTSFTGSRGSAPAVDPLRAVIVDLLQGWGDLTNDDTKRLGVFRPEKVVEAVETLDLSKEIKGSQYARTRLTQLRQYAGSLEVKAKRTEVETPSIQPVEPAADATPIPTETPEAVATPVAEVSVAEPAEPAEAAVADSTEPVEAATSGPEPAEVAPAEAGPGPVETEAAEADEWFADTADWQYEEVETFEEVVAEEAPADAAQASSETSASAEKDVLAARTHSPDDSLSSLHMKIRTADDLLALPAEQQADMVVFLEPGELSKVFQGTDDPALKKSVVDMLEHVGNPSSLDVLRRCLDDPDPEVQLYALEAADRLLGVDR